jgi:hypothetical protein
MDKKYIIVVSRRGRKRAVTIKKSSVEAARKHLEQVMKAHNWQDGELYENDCLTPAMEDGYIIDSSCHLKLNGELTWKTYKYKPI